MKGAEYDIKIFIRYLISLKHQQAYIDSHMGKVDYYEVCINIHILAMQALFVMEFLPKTKITKITIIFEIFSILSQFGKICFQISIYKGLIEPHCRAHVA